MKSVRTLITTSLTAAVATVVLFGGTASASTGGSGHKHGHCHHTKHGRGHAYGHRNHDHSCTLPSVPATTVPDTSSPATSPSTTVPASASEPAAESESSVISRPGSDIVIIEEPAPETSETPLPSKSVAPRSDETPIEAPATSPVNTTAPVISDETSSPKSVDVTIPRNAEDGVGLPEGDNEVAIPAVVSSDGETQASGSPEVVNKNAMGIEGSISLWWLAVLLAVVAETIRRIRNARNQKEVSTQGA